MESNRLNQPKIANKLRYNLATKPRMPKAWGIAKCGLRTTAIAALIRHTRQLLTMQTPTTDVRALAKSGVEALRKGDARKARALFEQIVASGQADASTCVALAYACRNLNDGAATLVAIDRAPAR